MRFRSPGYLLFFCAFLCFSWPFFNATNTATAQPTDRPATGRAIPRRIVTFSPNLTETVFALGAGDRVVGVTDFCRYPAEVAAIRRCGGWMNPNFEVLSGLRPDLIMAMGRNRKLGDFCQARGIAFRTVEMDSFATILGGIKQVGDLLACEDAATSLTIQIRKDLAALEKQVAKETGHPEVFVSVGRQVGSLTGIYTIAGGSFLDEALRLVGGRNVFEDLQNPYPSISKESLIARRPEVILELAPGMEVTEQNANRLRKDWLRMGSIPAVRDGRIHILNEDYLLTPGPRLALTAQRLYEAIHQ